MNLGKEVMEDEQKSRMWRRKGTSGGNKEEQWIRKKFQELSPSGSCYKEGQGKWDRRLAMIHLFSLQKVFSRFGFNYKFLVYYQMQGESDYSHFQGRDFRGHMATLLKVISLKVYRVMALRDSMTCRVWEPVGNINSLIQYLRPPESDMLRVGPSNLLTS